MTTTLLGGMNDESWFDQRSLERGWTERSWCGGRGTSRSEEKNQNNGKQKLAGKEPFGVISKNHNKKRATHPKGSPLQGIYLIHGTFGATSLMLLRGRSHRHPSLHRHRYRAEGRSRRSGLSGE